MAKIITEPNGYQTLEEAQAACDPATQTITTELAGMEDGTVVTLFQVSDKSEQEIQAYRMEQAKAKCSEIVDKILAGTSTPLDITQFDLLTKYIQNQSV